MLSTRIVTIVLSTLLVCLCHVLSCLERYILYLCIPYLLLTLQYNLAMFTCFRHVAVRGSPSASLVKRRSPTYHPYARGNNNQPLAAASNIKLASRSSFTPALLIQLERPPASSNGLLQPQVSLSMFYIYQSLYCTSSLVETRFN